MFTELTAVDKKILKVKHMYTLIEKQLFENIKYSNNMLTI